MKYVLFVSFSYKHYKKKNCCRIYLDDTLLDEIILEKNINRVGIDYVKNTLDKHSWLCRDLVHKHRSSGGTYPLLTDRLWLYEVDIPDGHEPNIKLDFILGDSNYTNGFMTKSALVRLERVGLIKLEEFKKMLSGSYYEIWGYFKNLKKKFEEQFKHGLKEGVRYPTADRFTVITKNDNEQVGNFIGWDQWVGEDFSATVKTITKHRTLILQGDTRVPVGLLNVDPIFLLMSKHKDVINMYNEDF